MGKLGLFLFVVSFTFGSYSQAANRSFFGHYQKVENGVVVCHAVIARDSTSFFHRLIRFDLFEGDAKPGDYDHNFLSGSISSATPTRLAIELKKAYPGVRGEASIQANEDGTYDIHVARDEYGMFGRGPTEGTCEGATKIDR